jgi:hypothetical protein
MAQHWLLSSDVSHLPGDDAGLHLGAGGIFDGPAEPGPSRQVCLPARHLRLLHRRGHPGSFRFIVFFYSMQFNICEEEGLALVP